MDSVVNNPESDIITHPSNSSPPALIPSYFPVSFPDHPSFSPCTPVPAFISVRLQISYPDSVGSLLLPLLFSSILVFKPSSLSSLAPSLSSILVITLDPSSSSTPSETSEFGEALEDFARDLPNLEEDSHDFSIDPPSHNGTPESGYQDSLNYFLNQFSFLDLQVHSAWA